MSDVVVDSSVVAKWMLPEVDSALAVQLRTEVPAAGGQLIVLDLILPEVGNAIWKSHRRKTVTLSKARNALAALKSIPLHLEPAARLLDQAFEIAVKYDLAVYDALFVVLVQDLGVKGVTADEPLYNTTHADFPQIITPPPLAMILDLRLTRNSRAAGAHAGGLTLPGTDSTWPSIHPGTRRLAISTCRCCSAGGWRSINSPRAPARHSGF